MEDQDSKTEEPTQRKLEKAKEEGQFARSQDLTIAVITCGAAIALILVGQYSGPDVLNIMSGLFYIEQDVIRNPSLLQTQFLYAFTDYLSIVSPVIIVTIILAVLSSFLFGGIGFSLKAVMPKAQKINPLSGLKRIFSSRSLFELVKSFLKLTVIMFFLYICYQVYSVELLSLGMNTTDKSVISGLSIVARCFLLLAVSLLLIAAVDVPYQLIQFKNQQKMSMQEIKDEFKDSDGHPEVKRKIREKQRETAMANMMEAIKDADVVVTNPNHFAVALSYKVGEAGAPVVTAKGMNLIAEKIKETARAHGVTIFEQPDLARALYFSTEINTQIPEKLYKVVAEVIAYVYNLNAFVAGRHQLQKPSIWIPPDYKYDEYGRVKDERKS
ncbi:MAG: flagellar biosynthesis protein FlhB [Gammaproteobacteria bacterium]|nr:flagellar biosynthesis protein FlhB [Gammaproteobacteria bacterium]